MSVNGHISDLSADDIDRIMDEWGEITDDIKKRLHNSILKASRFEEERELDILLTIIIPACFQFGYGAEPPDLDDGVECDAHYMWNCPKFAQKIHERAQLFKKTTRELIEYVLSPVFRDSPQAETTKSLKRLLLMREGREILLKRILGEDELGRVEDEGIFKDGIQKVSKRRKPDSSDDPEELKSISEFTATRA